ncbi:MAG TPA: signal peptide peptidase SppA [Smithellaceae bacterium]|jgi:protease-4|nr:signal peptide peptidase SppA [Smithellaceae bacterium]HNV63823.1 signal peptide peptidase SppA [Smithellaceae bacterium]HOD30053.1 signal peptide peptidase SppA [Smithellaceae bacterium]HOF77768.1 signal peptide peptidase SppA [Smithellaceae bacterium]HOM69933.1 signal peptide peptidase SppA [Smithellaceae bacterium]
MRKHPVILGMVILFVIALLSYLLFYKAGAYPTKIKTFSSVNRIGVVSINGPIYDSLKISEQLEEFANDGSIIAVVLRVDSPGGSVAASQEIYDAVVELRKSKKVVASMGSIAASGGLLVACAADKIIANPGTITGSISAIMQFANFEELLKKIGLKSSVVKSGKYKDIGSPLRDMTPEERKIIQELVDDIYNQFIDVVVKDRKLSREKVLEIADGRVFSGRRAKEYGLIDDLGDMNYAAKLATQLAGKDGKYELVYPRKKRESVFDYLLESAANRLSDSLKEGMESFSGVSYLYYPYK